MQNEIICEIGPKGSGKTHDVCESIREMDRVVVFDMVHEEAYADIIREDNTKRDPSEPETSVIITGNPKALVSAVRKDKFRVIYRPVDIQPQKGGIVLVPEFGPVCSVVYTRGNCWFVIDEAHILTDANNCPKELMISNYLGRHRDMSMFFISQSFTGIHPKIRRNADEFRFWRIIEPSDLEAIRKRCGKDVEEQVRELRVLQRDRKTRKLIRPGQMLRWDKLVGVVEITDPPENNEAE
jgi:DNA helicase HerA-like ATPase